MLESINMNQIEDLFAQIPPELRMKNLDLPVSKSEMAVQNEIKKLANKNKTDYACFLGAGAYKRFIPACVGTIASRFEFNTAYTPYQPEISQGTLQVIYEYQSMLCNLTGMDVANASTYDGATACAEGVLMSVRITGKKQVLVSNSLNPEYKQVVKTYCDALGVEIQYFDDINELKLDDSTCPACILVQNPNFYGEIEDLNPAFDKKKSLLVTCVDLVSLALLRSPKELGADIVVGDIQSLGSSMCFGGPYGGYIACLEKYKRQLPGRIVGRTLDADGNQAFTLTLQAREQHIRREKATSNICSNQALVALQATVYLSAMGKEGFKQVAYLSAKNAHKLADGLKNNGIEILNKNFFNEFVIKVKNSDEFLAKLKSHNILGGLKLDDNKILVCATELNDETQIADYIAFSGN